MATKVPMSGTPDPVVDAYKPGFDRTLIRGNLKRSPEERLRALQQLQALQKNCDIDIVYERSRSNTELELIRDERSQK